MLLNWYCTDMLEMRHQCGCGLLWIFKRLLVSLLGRQRVPPQSVLFLIVNIQADRVAIVSSLITKIFNRSKYWTVTIQLLLNDTLLISACIVYCQFLLFDVCLCFSVLLYSVLFVWFSAFCLIQFFVQYSSYSVHPWTWEDSSISMSSFAYQSATHVQ